MDNTHYSYSMFGNLISSVFGMRRLFLRLTLTIILLAAFIVPLIPSNVFAQVVVDANIYLPAGFGQPSEVKSFYANSRYWVFFVTSNTDKLYVRSSTNYTDWDSRTEVRSDVDDGQYASVWWDGTYGYYVVSDKSDKNLYFRRFTPNSDGSIDYSATEQLIATQTAAGRPFVSVDSNGYPWAIVNKDVYKASTTDGTWTTDEWWENISFSDYTALVPLTSGKMLLVATGTGWTLRVKRWTGSSWGAEREADSLLDSGFAFSITAQDDDVHCVWLDQVGHDIQYQKYDYSINDFVGSETTLYTSSAGDSYPSILRATDTNDLYVFWGIGSTDHIWLIMYDYSETAWTGAVDWIDESVLDGITSGTTSNADYSSDSDNVGFYYVADAAQLKYKSLGETFSINTLEIQNISTTSATLRGEIVSLGFGSADKRGFFWNTTPSLSGATEKSEEGTFGVGVYSLFEDRFAAGLDYYVIAFAENEFGPSYGTWEQFSTYAGNPAITTHDPVNVTSTSADLRAFVTSIGGESYCYVWFEYGAELPLAEETGNITVYYSGYSTIEVTGLLPFINYICRAVITRADGSGESYGGYVYFWTSYEAGEGEEYSPQFLIPVYTAWGGYHHVTGNATHTDWTGESTYVDERFNLSDDSDYITSETHGQKQTYDFENWVETTATISYVQVIVRGRVLDADDDAQLLYRESATDYNLGDIGLGTSFVSVARTFTTNPADSQEWTTTDITNMEWGVQKSGSDNDAQISHIYVKVVPATLNGSTTYEEAILTGPLNIPELAEEGYIDNDCLDIYLSMDFGSIASDVRVWEESLSVGEQKPYNMVLGYSVDRDDYQWFSTGTDTVTVTGHADFDIVGNLTIITTISAAEIPAASFDDIVNKTDAYYLSFGNATWVKAGIYDTSEYTVEYNGLSLDTEYGVKFTYDGDDLKLYLDVGSGYVEVDSTSHTGTIDTNGNDLSILEVKGYYDDLMIGKTDIASPTYVLNYEFEPDQISSIEDQSSGGNGDGSYTLGQDQSGLSIWFGTMVPLMSTTYTDPGEVSIPSLIIPPPQAGMFTSECGSELPFYILFSNVAADTGVETCSLYMMAIVSFAMGCGFLALLLTGSSALSLLVMIIIFGGATTTGVMPIWMLVIFGLMAVSGMYVLQKV